MTTCRTALLLLMAAFATGVGAMAATTEPADEVNFLVLVDGTHIGSARWTTRGLPDHEVHDETMSLRTTQARGRAAIDTEFRLERRPDGGLAYERHFVAGLMAQRDAGRIVDGKLVRDGGKGATTLPAGTVFGFELAARLRAWPSGSTAAVFPYFDIRALRAVPAKIAACPAAVDRDARFRCVAFSTQGLPAQEEHWFFDVAGNVQRIESDFGGLPMRLERCKDDCRRTVARPMDLIGRMVVASPYRIPESASQRTLRYVLSRRDGKPLVVVDTGDQTALRADGKAVVTVCRGCGGAATDDAGAIAAMLLPNAWLQSDSREVRRLGVRAGESTATIDSRMRRLVATVQESLRSEVNYMGYTDAVQAIRNRRGGCAEFAAVLAALSRSQGIPTRVVVGLAYSDRFSGRKEVFSPHVWVQVYDGGRWVSYDAALGDFDSTHIALAVGNGSPDEMYAAFAQLPHLVIERAGVVKTP